MDSMNPSPEGDASATRRGLVNLVAQVFAGVKTFTDQILSQNGIEISSGDLTVLDGVVSTPQLQASNVFADFHRSTAGIADASSVAYGPSGDDNTGIWFPAADTINIVTGGLLRVQIANSGYAYFNYPISANAGVYTSGFPASMITSNGSLVDIGSGIPARSIYMVGSGATTAFFASGNGAYSAPGTLRLWSETLGGTSGDIVIKAGAYIADASFHSAGKLNSWRTGLGGTEVEYMSLTPKAGAFSAMLVIDAKSTTHRGSIGLVNVGPGDGGLFFETGATAGGAHISTGNGLMEHVATNRPFKFYLNSDAFGGSGYGAAYDFNSSGAGTYLNTKPLLRIATAASGHTGRLFTALVNSVEKFGLKADGKIVSDAGWESSAGSSTVTLNESYIKATRGPANWSLNEAGGGTAQLYTTSGGYTGFEAGSDLYFHRASLLMGQWGDDVLTLKGTNSIAFETYGTDMTTPPVGDEHTITINATKGRGIHSGSYGTTKVVCDKCTADSVVVVMMEDVFYPAYCVQPEEGQFYIRNDGGGYDNYTFRFVVFN